MRLKTISWLHGDCDHDVYLQGCGVGVGGPALVLCAGLQMCHSAAPLPPDLTPCVTLWQAWPLLLWWYLLTQRGHPPHTLWHRPRVIPLQVYKVWPSIGHCKVLRWPQRSVLGPTWGETTAPMCPILCNWSHPDLRTEYLSTTRLEATSRLPLPSFNSLFKKHDVCFCIWLSTFTLIGKVEGSNERYPHSQEETHRNIT